MIQIDPKMLEILVCPITFGSLTYNSETQELISKSAKISLSHSKWNTRYAAR